MHIGKMKFFEILFWAAAASVITLAILRPQVISKIGQAQDTPIGNLTSNRKIARQYRSLYGADWRYRAFITVPYAFVVIWALMVLVLFFLPK